MYFMFGMLSKFSGWSISSSIKREIA